MKKVNILLYSNWNSLNIDFEYRKNVLGGVCFGFYHVFPPLFVGKVKQKGKNVIICQVCKVEFFTINFKCKNKRILSFFQGFLCFF